MDNWRDTIISSDSSIRDAMQLIDRCGVRVALVADANLRLIGTVTDGDVRRGLLRQLDMSDMVSDVMNRTPLLAGVKTTRDERITLLEKNELLALPIVDDVGKLIGLSTLSQLMHYEKRDNPVFIMAGGFGTRLKPLTDNCPKPMLPIGDRPMLAHVLDHFIEQGFHKFYISTHYMPEVISSYFGNGSELKCSITYIHEETPLGTGGALGLLPYEMPQLPLIMVNGDVLTKLDFNRMLEHHERHGFDATMCVREVEHQVSFGVIESKGELITSIVEKPTYRYYINSGIYILSSDCTLSVEPNARIDMPTLLELRMEKKFKVGKYISYDYWLDIGRLDDYKKAQQDIKGFSK